ncbi:putative toxin-antitoxin system toxin component, PIN family [Lonepinella koalarum]|uniref:Putative PIN family toxin of toxin-antitoxin system n=1 Tax=Lonepinella koalarum TaxID=53417 RepID=A0A4R1L019_9PAST|nr:putative toxin-antitoxin system toxin component, PIN family [Lonepinella koalarum]MDH2926067.1 putative toxin-antitoxin system toxin component, PIN family [Lonepinella koalarum]TCK71218.1 putative PIN family toxin of toxin-antitoxin system [Lonepinella koalarum]TFJ90944.1 putative toxin-antitoxin system toxin component, PIN family [Lonepinella koalarum]
MLRNNRIVIDTNILINAAIFPHSVPNQVLQKALQYYQVFVSQQTLNEFIEVIRRPKFSRYFNSVVEREHFIQFFSKAVEQIEITKTITDCQDPKDNKFLEIAIAANARLLVTGDKKDLLSMNPYRHLSIITATEFLLND